MNIKAEERFRIDGQNFQIKGKNGITFSTVIHGDEEAYKNKYEKGKVEIAIIDNGGRLITKKCPHCRRGNREIESEVDIEKWTKILRWCIRQKGVGIRVGGELKGNRDKFIHKHRIWRRDRTLGQIAEKFGISRERVRQVEEKLRNE